MTELIITRGYPGSGKTFMANQWQQEAPNRARVNRDDLRSGMFGRHGVLEWEQEQQITKVQHSAVKMLLGMGVSVVVDDTNLRLKHARAWADLAASLGVEFKVKDHPLPIEDCIERDRLRGERGGRTVGADVIRSMAAKFPIGRWPEVVASPELTGSSRQYSGTPGKPDAWIVDIDGTLANHHGVRDPYDTSRYHLDMVHDPIRTLTHKLMSGTGEIVITSGRSEDFRDVTTKWLADNQIWYSHLVMRKSGDQRRDDIVKEELFWEHIAPRYNVLGCIDDRDRVVRKWRAMGLTCLQVAEGDF